MTGVGVGDGGVVLGAGEVGVELAELVVVADGVGDCFPEPWLTATITTTTMMSASVLFLRV